MTIDPAHTGQSRSKRRLRVLVVDDEAPSLADLVYELKTFEEVAEVVEAENADNALRALRDRPSMRCFSMSGCLGWTVSNWAGC